MIDSGVVVGRGPSRTVVATKMGAQRVAVKIFDRRKVKEESDKTDFWKKKAKIRYIQEQLTLLSFDAPYHVRFYGGRDDCENVIVFSFFCVCVIAKMMGF